MKQLILFLLYIVQSQIIENHVFKSYHEFFQSLESANQIALTIKNSEVKYSALTDSVYFVTIFESRIDWTSVELN